jgi:hypothetical protein
VDPGIIIIIIIIIIIVMPSGQQFFTAGTRACPLQREGNIARALQ